MSSTVNLLVGSVFKMLFKMSFPSAEIYLGQLYSPERIFLYNAAVFGSSNGRNPQIIANKIIPQDQMSTWMPC